MGTELATGDCDRGDGSDVLVDRSRDDIKDSDTRRVRGGSGRERFAVCGLPRRARTTSGDLTSVTSASVSVLVAVVRPDRKARAAARAWGDEKEARRSRLRAG